MTYRREIDGLRALAVVPVILFHAGFKTFSGGFIGVDVFFVIKRRARRILPALFLVMAVTCIIAYAWMLPDKLKNFGQSLLATTLFSNNILLAVTTSYWSMASDFKPLLHTWSLGVEEQYYVIFPLLMIVGWKMFRTHLGIVLGVAATISVIAGNWGLFSKPELTFYLLPARAWELMVGALTAFYMIGKKSDNWLFSELLGGTGFCLIVASIVSIGHGHPSNGTFYLAAPTLGTALIILFASTTTVVGRILGWSPVVGVGLISYSAYLWHQPIFSLARVYSKEPPGRTSYVVLLVLTFILAYLTWRFIETPCRNRNNLSRTAIFFWATGQAADLDKRIYNEKVFRKKRIGLDKMAN